MRRVSVVGTSGAGKSTLGRALAQRLGVPFVELDSIYHQPGWQPLPVQDFTARVDAATRADGWVVDGNYSAVRELVWSRADTVVWLDIPRYRVMRRLVARTLRRIVLRVELWNGNRERWRNFFARDPKESLIVYAWTRHATHRERYLAASSDPARGHLTFVRIRSRRDVRALLDGVGPPTVASGQEGLDWSTPPPPARGNSATLFRSHGRRQGARRRARDGHGGCGGDERGRQPGR